MQAQVLAVAELPAGVAAVHCLTMEPSVTTEMYHLERHMRAV